MRPTVKVTGRYRQNLEPDPKRGHVGYQQQSPSQPGFTLEYDVPCMLEVELQGLMLVLLGFGLDLVPSLCSMPFSLLECEIPWMSYAGCKLFPDFYQSSQLQIYFETQRLF